MSNEQMNEARRIVPKLEECRQFLDNARFYMGHVDSDDPDYKNCSKVYDYICKALDVF